MNIDFLQTELKRIAGWLEFSDKKTAFLSIYYTAILGLLINQKNIFFLNIQNFEGKKEVIYVILLICLLISFFIGLFFLFNSLFPRLKNNFTNKSLFYFGNIANMKFVDYLKDVNNLKEDDFKNQIIEQIYTNSLITNTKMNNIRRSSMFFGITLILFVLLFISF